MNSNSNFNRTRVALLSLLGFCSASIAAAQGPAVAPVAAPKPPAVSPPVISPPAANSAVNSAAAPAGATATGAPTAASTARAPLVVPAFDEATFKTASASGQPIVLLFAAAGDSVWTSQAAAFQTILRDPEFAQRVPAYQVDMTMTGVVATYGVKTAGTILVTKNGVERLRSTGMVKPDVIKKMLRLRSVL